MITKRTRDGRTVEITAFIRYDTAWARAVLEGQEIGTGVPGVIPPISDAPEYTHGLGRLGLTTDEYDAVMAMLAEALAEHEATPEGQHAILRRQRERLVDMINATIDDVVADKAAAFDRGDLARYFRYQEGADETAIAQAQAALGVFDREHPEILAEVTADRARRTDAAMWR